MERENRKKTPALIDYILDNTRKFSFVQAVRLLRLIITDGYQKSLEEKEMEQRIRTRPKLSFDFPGTDITKIEIIQESPLVFLITVTFLGIYGSSSPLPPFYTEDILREREDDRSITRDFLDIINMPLYPLLFKTWSKYQIPYKIIEERDTNYIERCFDLIGLGEHEFRSQLRHSYLLLRYLELFTQFPRSAESLRVLLKDALRLDNIDIIQCVENKLPIERDQWCLLGISGNRLGTDSIIGRYVQDRMGKFRIEINVNDPEKLNRVLPDGPDFFLMEELIGFYLASPLKWDVRINVDPNVINTVCLGGRYWSRLGWNTWVFSGEYSEKDAFTIFSNIKFS